MKECRLILDEVQAVLGRLRPDGIDRLLALLESGRTLFTIGEGRSGLMAKSFAMRLFHLGLRVYVVGETIAPAIRENDVLIAVSGSGTSAAVVSAAAKARESQAVVIGVTTDAGSPLAGHADDLIVIEAATRYRKHTEATSAQPLGSLFDQCAHIVFDAVCLRYAESRQVTHQDAFLRHTNL